MTGRDWFQQSMSLVVTNIAFTSCYTSHSAGTFRPQHVPGASVAGEKLPVVVVALIVLLQNHNTRVTRVKLLPKEPEPGVIKALAKNQQKLAAKVRV